eukprot:COSAG06_NODE_21251_length_764_cov_0.751880_2_plen_65_part_00
MIKMMIKIGHNAAATTHSHDKLKQLNEEIIVGVVSIYGKKEGQVRLERAGTSNRRAEHEQEQQQ